MMNASKTLTMKILTPSVLPERDIPLDRIDGMGMLRTDIVSVENAYVEYRAAPDENRTIYFPSAAGTRAGISDNREGCWREDIM